LFTTIPPSARDGFNDALAGEKIRDSINTREIVAEGDWQAFDLHLLSTPPLAQFRRIYLVGGGSHNVSIAALAGQVLGGSDDIYRLDAGGNACALGAA
jgi:FGGY family of carbohydrate kinases, C-terminal domain